MDSRGGSPGFDPGYGVDYHSPSKPMRPITKAILWLVVIALVVGGIVLYIKDRNHDKHEKWRKAHPEAVSVACALFPPKAFADMFPHEEVSSKEPATYDGNDMCTYSVEHMTAIQTRIFCGDSAIKYEVKVMKQNGTVSMRRYAKTAFMSGDGNVLGMAGLFVHGKSAFIEVNYNIDDSKKHLGAVVRHVARNASKMPLSQLCATP